jgi:hypothetical protein
MIATADRTVVIHERTKRRIAYRTDTPRGPKTTSFLLSAYDSCTQAQRADILERLIQTIRQEGHALTPEREMDFRRAWHGF